MLYLVPSDNFDILSITKPDETIICYRSSTDKYYFWTGKDNFFSYRKLYHLRKIGKKTYFNSMTAGYDFIRYNQLGGANDIFNLILFRITIPLHIKNQNDDAIRYWRVNDLTCQYYDKKHNYEKEIKMRKGKLAPFENWLSQSVYTPVIKSLEILGLKYIHKTGITLKGKRNVLILEIYNDNDFIGFFIFVEWVGHK